MEEVRIMKNQVTNKTFYCFAETQVVPEDITCVHAALKTVDPEALLCILLETRLSWKMDPRLLTGAAKRHLMKKTTSMLNLMYDIEPVPLQQPDRVIIPVQTFEYPGQGCSFTRRISAAILDVSSCAGESGSRLDYAVAISQCAPTDATKPWFKGLESADELISAAWTEVLGHAIWLPSSLTVYERLSELAHLFWVMAFGGFAEAVHEMSTVNLRRYGGVRDVSDTVALCFDEQEQKMASIAALLGHNSFVDVCSMAGALKRSLVA